MVRRREDAVAPQSRSAAENGPRILFFTGGTALRPVCRLLKRETHNSIHLVTPFDSGGSSGPLREAFGMPAVGDLRNRLVALADDDVPGAAASARLVSHRFDARTPHAASARQLDRMVRGDDPLVAEAPSPLGAFARAKLETFRERMPRDFDLRGASVGNLILTGAWLEDSQLEPVVRTFAEMLTVRGTVLPTVDADLHLAVRLEDGRRVVGQHRFTGKEHPTLTSPVRELALVSDLEHAKPVRPNATPEVLAAIGTADLICFPMGSFFSSVLCNLLPRGIGRAVAEASCPKVYVPSAGTDPEAFGIDTARAVALLLAALRRDAGPETETDRLLDSVLLWQNGRRCSIRPTGGELARLTDRLADADPSDGEPSDSVIAEIDPQSLVDALMALAR